jgi:uncharacterized protein YyaL (SSP411 family)
MLLVDGRQVAGRTNTFSRNDPFLRQHRDNPVHWRPWSGNAFEEAQPILLSIVIGVRCCSP